MRIAFAEFDVQSRALFGPRNAADLDVVQVDRHDRTRDRTELQRDGLRGFRERRGVERDDYAAWAGLEAGGGAVIQSQSQATAYSGALALGAFAGLSVHLSRRVALGLEATLPAVLLRRDSRAAIVALPAGWFGVRASL